MVIKLHSLLLPQVRDAKPLLAKLETMDMGKPIDEAEWDMVRTHHSRHCCI
jgi:acyl-CoA reductase-like NAD-dependent aldehyde dehydrogenase